jgi:hypothetical protein
VLIDIADGKTRSGARYGNTVIEAKSPGAIPDDIEPK